MFPNNLLKDTHKRLVIAAYCLYRTERMDYLTVYSCFQPFSCLVGWFFFLHILVKRDVIPLMRKFITKEKVPVSDKSFTTTCSLSSF